MADAPFAGYLSHVRHNSQPASPARYPSLARGIAGRSAFPMPLRMPTTRSRATRRSPASSQRVAGDKTPRRLSQAERVAGFAQRPMPPEWMRSIAWTPAEGRFVPAPDVAAWIRRVFIESTSFSALMNTDHAHLATARIGVLWTNVKASRRGRIVLGTAELPEFKVSSWHRARQEQQLRDWFPEFEGELPDFIVTLSAPYAHAASNEAFCALVEHELYHCAQALDRNLAPAFSRETGCPLWTIKGHDVEEFVGVVRRWGARAAGVESMVHAASQHAREPVFSDADIVGACGACR